MAVAKTQAAKTATRKPATRKSVKPAVSLARKLSPRALDNLSHAARYADTETARAYYTRKLRESGVLLDGVSLSS